VGEREGKERVNDPFLPLAKPNYALRTVLRMHEYNEDFQKGRI